MTDTEELRKVEIAIDIIDVLVHNREAIEDSMHSELSIGMLTSRILVERFNVSLQDLNDLLTAMRIEAFLFSDHILIADVKRKYHNMARGVIHEITGRVLG